MGMYKVNADFTININTIVDADSIDMAQGEDLDEAIRRQAISQIFDTDYETGDPVTAPNINWVEELDE